MYCLIYPTYLADSVFAWYTWHALLTVCLPDIPDMPSWQCVCLIYPNTRSWLCVCLRSMNTPSWQCISWDTWTLQADSVFAWDTGTLLADSVFAKLAGGRRKQSSAQLAQQTGLDAGLFTLQKVQTKPLKLKEAAGTVWDCNCKRTCTCNSTVRGLVLTWW